MNQPRDVHQFRHAEDTAMGPSSVGAKRYVHAAYCRLAAAQFLRIPHCFNVDQLPELVWISFRPVTDGSR